MQTYNKLVRDKIPEMIEKNGEKCRFKKLDKQMYIKELREKFLEELNEYLQAKNDVEAIEELSDVLEIIHSLSKIHGKTIQDVEEVRRKKYLERGGFDEMLYLIEVDEES
jgi:predicted house-cleaning noncanonical NTP pyrophosphatase (MazG superfamily)